MKKSLFISILITIIIEIVVFNFGTLKSLFYKEIVYDLDNINITNAEYNEKSNLYETNFGTVILELDVNKKIKNMYIDIENVGKQLIELTLDYTDDANNNYEKYESTAYEKYQHSLIKSIEKSKYINVNHLGKTQKIKIYIENDESSKFAINKISFNKPQMLDLSFSRIFLIFLFVFTLCLYKIYKPFKDNIKKHEKFILLMIILLFSLLLSILYFNYSNVNIKIQDYYSTNYKDALMDGKLSFEVEENKLDELENAYDFTQRKVNYPWDVSYYNGKYYMYFSFLPALIIGITNLSISNLSLIFSIVATVFLALLTKKLIEKYYQKIDSSLKLLMIIFVLFNSRLLLLISRVRFYELIVICAFSFAIIGIYLYLLYDENQKIKNLILGSLFLSLSVVCRPNMIFVSILGLFIIYKELNKKNIVPFVLPYFIIGSILMYINYIRFGNVFEFGIKYQLSVVNMHYLKFNLNTVINGIFTYLLKMPNFIPNFPYITNNVSMINHYGFYFNSSTGNGIIAMSVLGLVLPFVYKKTDKKVLKFIICSIIVGLIILISDNCFGGAVKRYSLEFAWLFIIPIVLLTVNCLFSKKKTVLVLVIISCLMNFFIIFDNSKDDLGNIGENDFYYQIKYLIGS